MKPSLRIKEIFEELYKEERQRLDKESKWYKPHQAIDLSSLVLDAIIQYLDEIT